MIPNNAIPLQEIHSASEERLNVQSVKSLRLSAIEAVKIDALTELRKGNPNFPHLNQYAVVKSELEQNQWQVFEDSESQLQFLALQNLMRNKSFSSILRMLSERGDIENAFFVGHDKEIDFLRILQNHPSDWLQLKGIIASLLEHIHSGENLSSPAKAFLNQYLSQIKTLIRSGPEKVREDCLRIKKIYIEIPKLRLKVLKEISE